MAIYHSRTGDVFESHCDLVDVTSLHRPDTAWRATDAFGHEHRWYVNDKPATLYDPSARYSVPTLIWIRDSWGYYEDGERYAIGHHECRECGERIEPRYRADDIVQHIPGLRSYRINGEPVSPEEFQRRFTEAQQ